MKMRRALRPRPLTHSLARLSSAGAIAAVLQVASAQVVWDGQAGDGLWTNPVNWAGNIAPTPFDTVSFGTGGAGLVRLSEPRARAMPRPFPAPASCNSPETSP